MSFLSGIGNIFHSIGHFFEGGDEENQPQQNNRPTLVQPTQPPAALFRPQPQQAQQSTPAQQPAPNGVNLYQPPQKANQVLDAPVNANSGAQHFDIQNLTNGTLAKAQPPQPATPPSTAQRVVNTLLDASARAGVGIGQQGAQLFDTLTPGKGTNRVTKAFDEAAKTTDQEQAQEGLQGPAGNTLYRGTQVLENILPAAGGLVEGATKIPALVKAAPDLIKGIPDAVKAIPDVVQGAGEAVDSVLAKVHPANLLNKAGVATDIAAPLDETGKAADEVAVGLRSVNPNQVEDATNQLAAKDANAALNAPANSIPGATPPGPETPIAPTPGGPPGPALEAQTAPASGDSSLSPTAAQPPSAPQIQPAPVESSSLPNNVAQNLNEVNPLPSGRVAPNAPNMHAQVVKDLETAGAKAGDITNTTHDVLSDQDLNTAAQRVVQSMPDEQLVGNYKTGAAIHNAADLAQANAAISRLGELSKAGNPDADRAIENILDGTETATSSAGRLLKYTQSMYDSLPKEAKVKYLVRSINKARTAAGLEELSLPEQANAETTIDHFLTETENARAQQAAAKGEIQSLMDKTRPGGSGADRADLAQIDKLQSTADSAGTAAEKLQGDLAKAYDQLAPGKLTAKRVGQRFADMGRSLMLTSVSGRANDVVTTGINAAHSLVQSNLESVVGKFLNAGRAAMGKEPGKYIDTLTSPRSILQGTKQGLEKAVGNFKGEAYVGDVQKAIKSGNEGGKAELARATGKGALNKIRGVAHAMAETATNISQGVKNAELTRLAYQEGKSAGLKGVDLDVYARGRAALPSRVMEANATRLHEEVNNMNDNPISEGMGKLGDVFSKLPVVGDQIRNLTVPFSRWVGGQMWNGLTDKNAIANIYKIGKAVMKGDDQEVVRQLAGLATNTVGTMGAGYALAKAGMLTTKNAQGYNDDGLYLRFGGHYIPVGFLGFSAPGIVMGYATHQALNEPGGTSVAQKIVDATGTTLGALARSYLGNTVIGGNNELLNTIQEALKGKSGTTGTDVAATAGAEAVGQYVPAAAGDVNAVLNNYTPFNPTHEAALTKVTKGESGVTTPKGKLSTAKDVVATSLRKVENRVPGLSQMLPRNPAAAAPDFIDRISRGDHTGAPQAAAAAAKATATQSLADDIKNGVPVYKAPAGTAFPKGYSFDNTLKSAQENGNYDLAIKGLQSKLKVLTTPGPEHNPPSTIKAVKDQVTQMQVLKDGKYTPDDMAQYHSVSNSEWRKMGDPTSDAYDPKTYQKLYALDQSLAGKGIADGTLEKAGSKSTGKFYLAANRSGSRSGSSRAETLVKDNTVGSLPSLARENFMTNLSAKPITARVPQIKLTSPESLIKKRSISVASPRGNYN